MILYQLYISYVRTNGKQQFIDILWKNDLQD